MSTLAVVCTALILCVMKKLKLSFINPCANGFDFLQGMLHNLRTITVLYEKFIFIFDIENSIFY